MWIKCEFSGWRQPYVGSFTWKQPEISQKYSWSKINQSSERNFVVKTQLVNLQCSALFSEQLLASILLYLNKVFLKSRGKTRRDRNKFRKITPRCSKKKFEAQEAVVGETPTRNVLVKRSANGTYKSRSSAAALRNRCRLSLSIQPPPNPRRHPSRWRGKYTVLSRQVCTAGEKFRRISLRHQGSCDGNRRTE